MDQLLQALIESIPPIADGAPQTLNVFVFFVQWAAIILSALAGLYAARKHGMDVYGALVIGFIVALGGGTIRDLLLGRYPIYWIADPVYVVTVVIVTLLFVLIVREAQSGQKLAAKIAQPVERLAYAESNTFMIVDSLALGLWAYLGAVYSLQMGAPLVIAPIMGIITATFGGVLRDVFFAQVPQTFLPSQLYASAAAAGAVAYVLLSWLGASEIVGFLICFVLAFLIRVASVKLNIQSR